MLESNLKWNPLLQPPNPIPFLYAPLSHSPRPSSIIRLHRPSKFNLKCLFANANKTSSEDHNSAKLLNKLVRQIKNNEHPFEVVARGIVNALKALRKPAVAALLVGLFLMYDPNSALAASGGRVGGRSFSSRNSSSSSSRSYSTRIAEPSFSYSVPYYAPSPFGFGGGGVYVGPAVGVGSSFFLIMMSFAAFILVSGFLSDRSEGSLLTATDRTSVLKLQV